MGSEEHRPLSVHHQRIRERGVNPWVYWPTRIVLQPFILLFWRLRRGGRDHVPRSGPLLLAANHRSFLDPFIVGVSVNRPIYFVAKRELFDRRICGRILNALGAFPIKRGESDEEAMTTARVLLERGEAVLIFPEGTRHRSGPIQEPKRGVGRLALETGAPIVPIALKGTENARNGYLLKPVKLELRFGSPLTYPRVEEPSKHLANEVTARIWPCVQLQYAWLGGSVPARRTAERPAAAGAAAA